MTALTGHMFSQLRLGGIRVFLLNFGGTTAAALVTVAVQILGPDELKLWDSFPLERKRNEWLAGRVVAKAALQDRVGREGMRLRCLTHLQVMPETGRTGPVRSPMGGTLSISHSGTVAAAVHSTRPIGVDIEQVRPFSPAIQREILSHQEARLLRREVADHGVLSLLWSAKEAVLKARRAEALTEIRKIVWQGWGKSGVALIEDNGCMVPFVRAGLLRNHALAIASHNPDGKRCGY